jgi:hypothetical protein
VGPQHNARQTSRRNLGFVFALALVLAALAALGVALIALIEVLQTPDAPACRRGVPQPASHRVNVLKRLYAKRDRDNATQLSV